MSSELFLIFYKREEIMDPFFVSRKNLWNNANFFCCGEINERMNRLAQATYFILKRRFYL